MELNRILSYEKHRVAYLVYEILAMIVAKFLGSNDPMEICFHQLLNEIDRSDWSSDVCSSDLGDEIA